MLEKFSKTLKSLRVSSSIIPTSIRYAVGCTLAALPESSRTTKEVRAIVACIRQSREWSTLDAVAADDTKSFAAFVGYPCGVTGEDFAPCYLAWLDHIAKK